MVHLYGAPDMVKSTLKSYTKVFTIVKARVWWVLQTREVLNYVKPCLNKLDWGNNNWTSYQYLATVYFAGDTWDTQVIKPPYAPNIGPSPWVMNQEKDVTFTLRAGPVRAILMP